MNDSNGDKIKSIEASIKDLDLDYMRGLVSEEEYNTKITELKAKLEQLGGIPSGLAAAMTTPPPKPDFTPAAKKPLTDPVTAVKKAVQDSRRIPIERIAQDAGVDMSQVARILHDLLDGRELSGRIDHEAGDFILGTGTGPPPKTIASCPYCKADLNKIAVKGETVTCSMCKESFIVS